jgi:hypothetical protein
MEKITTLEEIKVDDIVRTALDRTTAQVLGAERSDDGGGVRLLLKYDGVQACWNRGPSDKPIILDHRPWPEGKTEKNMLNEIFVAMANATPKWLSAGTPEDMDGARLDLKAATGGIREAIEAYELGKP